ncbi:hypothetical protein CC78DRAFT_612999 [Lojkania enalia]|uniref:Uncharacterized protein n=1 Tax=Lojkania enalia TaxID=147567 RepID=A0A9P4N7A1_9PLEO|nr:hypothetical protein CC78DRAFT_612999 [Didymosphaeria enalia]
MLTDILAEADLCSIKMANNEIDLDVEIPNSDNGSSIQDRNNQIRDTRRDAQYDPFRECRHNRVWLSCTDCQRDAAYGRPTCCQHSRAPRNLAEPSSSTIHQGSSSPASSRRRPRYSCYPPAPILRPEDRDMIDPPPPYCLHKSAPVFAEEWNSLSRLYKCIPWIPWDDVLQRERRRLKVERAIAKFRASVSQLPKNLQTARARLMIIWLQDHGYVDTQNRLLPQCA